MLKKCLSFLLVLTLLAPVAGLCASAGKPVDFVMHNVTVYQGRAMVEKSASVELGAGENLFTVKGLPQDMVENTLLVYKADKEAAFLIKEFEYRDVETDIILKEEEKKLKDRLTVLQDEFKSKDDRLLVLQAKIKYYTDLSAKSASGASEDLAVKEVNVKNISDVLSYSATGLDSALKEKRRVEKDKIKLQDDITVTESELSNVYNRNTVPSRVLQIRLASNAPMRADIRLKYLTPNAGWYPAYEADYNSDKGSIDGKYYAMIYQSTTEKWANTKLTIATGSPMLDVTLPVPNPWFVREHQPVAAYNQLKSYARPAPSMMKAEAMGAAADSADYEEPARAPEALQQVSQGELDVRATLTGRFDIGNTGEVKRAPITDIKLKRKEVFYTAVPSQNSSAYLTVEFENNDDLVMVPGEVSLYMDGDYSGKSALSDRVRKGESLKFSFGVDENIKIKREKLTEKKGESGIFGSERKVDFGYRLTVENYKQREITAYIKEPMPFSQNDKIKVEMYEVNDKAFTDEDNGIRVWKVTLKPGEKKEIVYRVRVSFPKDMSVSGI